MQSIKIFALSCFLFLYSCFSLHAQQKIIDSLQNELKFANEDTSKVSTLNKLSLILWRTGSYETSLVYAQQTITLAEKLNFKKAVASAYNNTGTAYWYQGNYNKSLEAYIKSLVLMEKLGNKAGISDANNNIGMVYYYLGKYDKTIEFYEKSLKIDAEIGNKNGIALSYNNIGGVYDELGSEAEGGKKIQTANTNYDKAIAYYLQSLKLFEELGDQNGLTLNFNNLGNAYSGKGNCATDEGNAVLAKDQYIKAIGFHEKSLLIKKQLNDKNGIAGSLICLGENNLFLKNYNEALNYFNKALAIAREIGAKQRIKSAFAGLSKSYAGLRNFENAYRFHIDFADVKDSIYNEESSQQMADMQEKYQSEKKEGQIKLLNKDKEIQTTQLKRQQVIIWSIVLGLLLALVSGGIIFNRFKITQKQKRIIEQQKKAAEHQKYIVEEKQKEILDSIYYARRIQRALLPTEKYIARQLDQNPQS